jgi:hypothetical protein
MFMCFYVQYFIEKFQINEVFLSPYVQIVVTFKTIITYVIKLCSKLENIDPYVYVFLCAIFH